MPPTLLAALGFGLRALGRAPWLVAASLGIALVRRALSWPAAAVAWALLVRAALLAARERPLDPTAALEGALAVATSPRFLGIVLGLWLAGLAVGAVLRVAYLAGALPTAATAAAGAPERPVFAAGVAYGFPRVLAAAGLGLVLDAAAGLFGWTLALAALRVTVSAAGGGGSALLAAAVAGALTLAVAVPVAFSGVADAGVARAALRDEGPGEAFAAAGGRFLARPGTFVLVTLAFGVLAAVTSLSIQAVGAAVTGFAAEADPIVLAGPRLMLALAGAGAAAALDVVWLGTIAALACGEDRR